MSESMSCWICATIESALDDMAVLLLHNRWVVLPIIAQSRRSFNATMFTCRFRIRPHGLWSHSYDLADHQVEFVNQIMSQQIIPEYVAAKNQDIFAPLASEFGDLLVSVCAADDAGVLPRSRLFCGHAVCYDRFVYGVIE